MQGLPPGKTNVVSRTEQNELRDLVLHQTQKISFQISLFYVAQLLGGGGFGIRNVHTPPNTMVVPTV